MTSGQRVQRMGLILHANYLHDARLVKEPASVEMLRDLIALYKSRGSTVGQLTSDLIHAIALEANAENRMV